MKSPGNVRQSQVDLVVPDIRLEELNADTLMARARGLTGLSDWGGDGFRSGLEALLESLRTEAALNKRGRCHAWRTVARLLCCRLWLARRRAAHSRPPAPPAGLLVLAGADDASVADAHGALARTGRWRTLDWQSALYPVLPPGVPEAAFRAQVALAMEESAWMVPGEGAGALAPDSPADAAVLQQHTFADLLAPLRFRVPTYVRWLESQPMEPQVEEFLRLLEDVASRAPEDRRPWLLASNGPLHAWRAWRQRTDNEGLRVLWMEGSREQAASRAAARIAAWRQAFTGAEDAAEAHATAQRGVDWVWQRKEEAAAELGAGFQSVRTVDEALAAA